MNPEAVKVTTRAIGIVVLAVFMAGCSSFDVPTAASPAPAVAVAVHARTPATVAPEDPLTDRQVFVEGDSLTVGVAEFLPPLLTEAGWTVIVDAQVGRATATGVSILSQRASEIGGTLVVALGTNDDPDPSAFAAKIDQVMIIAAGRRVIWVTVARTGWDGLDRALIAAQYRWSNLHVIDWRPVIASYPSLEAGDGIHLTTAGYQLRAEFIAGAIETTR
jgi:lysophospholipase L1-like esterase